jgi:tetratricopeptide (TPR) repeat protein
VGQADYEKAIADLDQAVRLDPYNALAYEQRGFAYLQKNDPDKAIDDFNQAIRICPDFAGAYESRGLAYGALCKRYGDLAAVDFKEAEKLGMRNRGC